MVPVSLRIEQSIEDLFASVMSMTSLTCGNILKRLAKGSGCFSKFSNI